MPAANQTALSYDEGERGEEKRGGRCLQEQKTTRSGSGSACACELKSFLLPRKVQRQLQSELQELRGEWREEEGKGKGCSGSKNAHGKSKWRRQRRPQFVFSVRWRFDKVQPRNINKVDTRVCMPRVGAPDHAHLTFLPSLDHPKS